MMDNHFYNELANPTGLPPVSSVRKLDNLPLAIWIALDAHKGQKRLNGADYIIHPIFIMSRFTDVEHQIVALLHDVAEDGPKGQTYYIDLFRHFFNPEIADALDAITRRPYEQYFDYIIRLSSNKIAKAVKIEDLKHNRVGVLALSESGLLERYTKALEMLGAI